jgi:hypothetical protein
MEPRLKASVRLVVGVFGGAVGVLAMCAVPARSVSGLFALLGSVVHVNGAGASDSSHGSGAPARCLILPVLLVTLGALMLMATPAFAAAPEAPELTVEDTTAAVATPSTEAGLHGVLNPGLVGAPGTYELDEYQFLYKAGSTCTGGSLVPTPPGMSLGEGHEALPAEILSGLSVNTEYTVCLIVRNGTGPGHESSSTPVTFKTALPPEKPDTTSPAKLITATTATLEGTLNPHATVKAGWYFAYNLGANCVGGSTTTLEAEATVKAVTESKGVIELQPHAQYTFCLVATNAAGEAVPGNEVAVETEAAKPEVTSETTALPVKATEATLEAQVNPNNEATTYRFEYSTSATGETLNAPVTTLASATVLEGFGSQTASVATGPALAQDTTYYYRIVAANKTGTSEGTVAHFETAIAPETPEELEGEPTGPTTATLKGVLNPTTAGEAGTYEFAYQQSSSECRYVLSAEEVKSIEAEIAEAYSHNEREKAGEKEAELRKDRVKEAENKYTTPGSASGAPGQAVEADVSGLLPGAEYTICLIAHNSVGETAISAPVTFTTLPAAPKIVSESASGVTAREATLNAQIDSNGAETHYYFQYGTTESYGESTPLTKLDGALVAADTATATVSGLQPNTTYHYRVVATNSQTPGGKSGEDMTFTTPETPSTTAEICPNKQRRAEQPFGLALPDCRAYEMVSPVDSNGQDATDALIRYPPRASVSSEDPAITYTTRGVFANPTGSVIENQLLSRREPEHNRWATHAITPLHEPVIAELNPSYEQLAFTPELTEGIASTSASLTGQAPVGEGDYGLYVDDFANGAYQYIAEVLAPIGASTDLTHVVFSEGETHEAVSEWVSGKVVPVGVANNGESMSASVGDAAREAQYNAVKDGWRAVSADGSKVYFTSPAYEESADRQLYVRVNAEQPQPGSDEQCTVSSDACTIEVSASQRATPDVHGPQSARYWSASADGSRVFFTSTAELTEHAYTGPEDNAANLYEYKLASEPDKPGRLTDLTGEPADDTGEGAAVEGVVQVSEDGSHVYFVAEGVLTGPKGEALQNERGEGPQQGEPNLYVSDEGAIAFIATLAAPDASDWFAGHNKGPSEAGPADHTAVVSPTGEYLAFMSERSLTGYDSTQSHPGQCEDEIKPETGFVRETGTCREVYLYDAQTGGLVCASCDPTGARPVGPSGLNYHSFEPYSEYRPGNLLGDGTLFFNSSDALVPHASNGVENVYEYEDGRVHAVSDVTGAHPSFFLDASASGEDVFFATSDDLLPQDTGQNIVVYDARVGGGFPAPASVSTCASGESCEPPATPQPDVFGASGSATFSGPGNLSSLPPSSPVLVKSKPLTRAEKLAKALKVCRKKKAKRKRAACERSAHKKYGTAKATKTKRATKASDEMGAGR